MKTLTKIVAMCVVAMYALVGQVAAQEMPVHEGKVIVPDPFNLAVGFKVHRRTMPG